MQFLLSTLLTAAVSSAPAQDAVDTKAKVDAVFREYDRSDSPGCALGVFRDGRIEYARGYGMANLELGIANSPQTVFDIGSTSKQFTALAIHLLAREGKLSLDDDVRRWVPEVPDYGRKITLLNLLHHTSGLRDYIELMELQGLRPEDLTTERDSLAILSLQKAANFAPGEEHLYCNSGYFLLSVVVKRASGQSLREFAADRIFGPLGMRHSQFNDSHTRIIPGRATGYSVDAAGGFGIDMSDWEQTGDGAVLTTIEDLFRWDRNFYDPKVGDRRLLDEMLEPGVLNNGRKLAYASALVVGKHRGLPTVSHGGSWAGYRAQLLRFPEQRLSVACLCNLGEANPSSLARQVAEVYLGAWMTAPEPKIAAKEPGGRRLVLSPAELERLTGAYRDPAFGPMVVLSVHEQELVGKTGRRGFTLVPIANARFRLEGLPGGRREAVFVATGGAARPRMDVTTTLEDGEIERESFEPVDPWSPTASELASMAGTYASAELDTTWRLAVVDGGLVIRHRGLPEKGLTPTIADHFTLDRMELAFQRDGAQRITGFTLGESRVKGIVFRKQSGW